MTTKVNGLHQRRAAGEQKECNKGMMQRKIGAAILAAPQVDGDRSTASRKLSTYHVVSATLLQVLAAVQI